MQFTRKHGYPIETHYIVTEDHYIIATHRIPYGRKEYQPYSSLPRKPVLLITGILFGADTWTFTGPNKALAYILADNGYDVWLANPRGTTWSKNHTYLHHEKNKKQFWDFR